MNIWLLILIIVLATGGIGAGPWFGHNWGYAPSTVTLLIVVILVIILVRGGI